MNSKLNDLSALITQAVKTVVDARVTKIDTRGLGVTAKAMQYENLADKVVEELKPLLEEAVDDLMATPMSAWAAAKTTPAPTPPGLYQQTVKVNIRFHTDYTIRPSRWGDFALGMSTLKPDHGEQAEIVDYEQVTKVD